LTAATASSCATSILGLPSLTPFAFVAASADLVRPAINARSFSANRLDRPDQDACAYAWHFARFDPLAEPSGNDRSLAHCCRPLGLLRTPPSLALALTARGRRPQKLSEEKSASFSLIRLPENLARGIVTRRAETRHCPASERGSVSAARRARSCRARQRGGTRQTNQDRKTRHTAQFAIPSPHATSIPSATTPVLLSAREHRPRLMAGKCCALLLCRSGRRRCNRLTRSFGLPQKAAIGAVRN